jgi:hypothetical protein
MSAAESDELLARLIESFPSFEAEWLADRAAESDAPITLHSVWMSFRPYIGKLSLAPAQAERLAALLNEAVAVGGNSENAVSTCFLEALGPSPLRKAVWPLLWPATRASAGASNQAFKPTVRT